MIAFIKGILCDISEDMIVIENQGMGYSVAVPGSVIDRLPAVGTEVKVFTYLHVKEDMIGLYGFLTKDDLNIFKLLLTVNGIGPKGALGILSAMTADELLFAVLASDEKTIAKAPGIGKKTAQRMIIDLKDKLDLEDAFEHKLNNSASISVSESNSRNEAILALVALGYSQADAMRAVKSCDATDSMTTDEILKLALKKMMTF